MVKKLFLLDGMALVYRAHFAFISRPILTSKGVNTSALYGFTQTLLDILKNQQPTHLAVAFDTAAPTQRHVEFADYKANRQEMPEDLSAALPHVRRMVEAFNVPVLICDGYEADDIIGTLVRRAEKEGFQSYMVTSDKDFGQLVTPNTFIYKPGRSGEEVEILGLPEIQSRWGVQRPEQVVDVLALMGDASDNIPGVPGIGEKTAMKLIGQYGTRGEPAGPRGRIDRPRQGKPSKPTASRRCSPSGWRPSSATPPALCRLGLAYRCSRRTRRSSRGCWWSSSSTPLAGACSARSSRRGAEEECRTKKSRSAETFSG